MEAYNWEQQQELKMKVVLWKNSEVNLSVFDDHFVRWSKR